MLAALSTQWVRREAMITDIDAARQGLLKFIAKKGGSIPMRDLHTHSLVFYQAGHQAFSQLMETVSWRTNTSPSTTLAERFSSRTRGARFWRTRGPSRGPTRPSVCRTFTTP